MKILAADIGGTNSRFACFTTESGSLALVDTVWLPTREASSFGELLNQLSKSDFCLQPSEADAAVFAVAGPVEHGTYSNPPYVSWDIDLRRAESEFGISHYALINDFVAQAYACRSQAGAEATQIRAGEVADDATMAVIGAGTNLGKAMLVRGGDGQFTAVPSEGGHCNFPAESGRELDFQQFVLEQTGDQYLTWNNVVSGKGIAWVHEFLTGEKREPAEVTANWQGLARSATSDESLVWSARFYGRVCRNFALETLCYGGLFIAGGVAAKCPMLVRHEAFEREFVSSPKHGDTLQQIKISLITNEESGLWGSAFLGSQLLGSAIS